ncbi:dephospho-CoA kinase [Poritiphilus flavus]|uniref:Dephospho-CoA kinase n=1 Tax=Poritiphilus flavus TaxID=2697053 RepID=A0A6L9EFD1_9FLAO|nr:dephospho-CoA kinase [Poritiphilus flavus]NAS13391.1 dephospho-CoA kinase [Poritiphilus flavus]
MMIIGLTGGIGSGKTTVSKIFRSLGVPVYDSDKEAKELMVASEEVVKAIKALFGSEAYKGKKLNKNYIAERVFNDKELLGQLNAIVHPAVKKHFLSWAKKQNAAYVIQEAAILFENGSYVNYDKMILVTAPKKERIRRIMARDGSTEDQILARMKNQWSDRKKRGLADFVIENKSLEKTKSAVAKIHAELAKTSGSAKF